MRMLQIPLANGGTCSVVFVPLAFPLATTLPAMLVTRTPKRCPARFLSPAYQILLRLFSMSFMKYALTGFVGPLILSFIAFALHKGIKGELCFDQIKTVDKNRIVQRAGRYPEPERAAINQMLSVIFGEP
jgi:hypothetical protein